MAVALHMNRGESDSAALMFDNKLENDAPRSNDSARRPRHHLGHDGQIYLKALIGGPFLGWMLDKVSLRGLADLSLVKASNRLDLHLTRDMAEGSPHGGPRSAARFRVLAAAIEACKGTVLGTSVKAMPLQEFAEYVRSQKISWSRR